MALVIDYPMPRTLEGFKSRAKKLKRDFNLKHHEALDELGRAFGFKDFRAVRAHYER